MVWIMLAFDALDDAKPGRSSGAHGSVAIAAFEIDRVKGG